MNLIEKINQWWIPVLVGVSLSSVALFLMSQPIGTFLGLTIVFGYVIFLSGAFNIAFAIRNRHFFDGWIWYLMIGVFEVFLGTALLFQPKLSSESLILFTGFWLLFTAVSRVSFSFVLKKMNVSTWWLNLLGAIFTLFFAFLIIINPIIGMFSLVYLVTIPMFVSGIIAIYFGIQLKGINNTIKG
jgi:uncharacterized membrane protein HdeD (DUF308 family)